MELKKAKESVIMNIQSNGFPVSVTDLSLFDALLLQALGMVNAAAKETEIISPATVEMALDRPL